MDKASLTSLLSGSPLFSTLAGPARASLEAVLITRRLARETAIYLRGDEAEALYGVVSGKVRFSAASLEGKELVLDYAGPGEWFGEIGLFDGGPRVVDAFTAEETELVVLPRRELYDLCERERSLLVRFLELFSRRIRMAEDIILDAAFLTLPARLAKKLLLLAEDSTRAHAGARGPSIRVSQDELGRLTGVTRESAGKQLKQWEREGLVAVDYGRVELVDAAALARIVAAAVGS